jgi:hydroxyacylglutathione hydrolase
MRVHPVPCLRDNYSYLVVCEKTGESAIVDASEAGPVIAAVRAQGLKPRDIWSTHHHMDHVGGNEEVARTLGVRDIYGHVSDQEKARIPGQTKAYDTGGEFRLGELTVRTFHIPGHTLGAIAYVASDGQTSAAFTGDTLFCAGCGRLFEGTPAQMHASLKRLAALGPDVQVFCGHEYTENNLRFAKHVEPSNAAIDRAIQRARNLRAEGRPTVPTTMADELQTNPFVRTDSKEIRKTLAISPDADDATALGAIRKAKDSF